MQIRTLVVVVFATTVLLSPARAQQVKRPPIFNIYASVPEGNGREVEITTVKIAEL